jgi:nucleoside-diphosphate-sugar epimerase
LARRQHVALFRETLGSVAEDSQKPSVIAITGAGGFVGGALAQNPSLHRQDIAKIALNLPWNFKDISSLIHCAAKNNLSGITNEESVLEFQGVNVQLTENLARSAAAAGVRRFVFLSSAKVLQVTDDKSLAFSALNDPYTASKLEAERRLRQVASETGLEVVIIRPPLVYGPGVKGSFLRLMRLVYSGVPLPLAAVKNQRSFVALDNLIDLIIRCIDHPAAAGETLEVSDGQDISTPELLRTLARMMNKPCRLWPVPVSALRFAGSVLGKREEVDRVVGSFQVDSSRTKELLGWSPPVRLEAGLQKTVDWYLENRTK